MHRVCCIIPRGPEADALRFESTQKRETYSDYFSIDFADPVAIPHGYELYVCPWFMVNDLINRTVADRAAIIAFGPEKALAHSFDLGAQDYMKEPWGTEELLTRSKKLLEAPAIKLSWGTVRADGYESSVDGICLRVAPGVHRLFKILVSNAGKILSSSLLLRLLEVENSESRALSVYVSQIRHRLAFICSENAADVVRTHYGKGFSVKL